MADYDYIVIGSGSAGGMFVGTMIGVFVTPGLYYLFAKLAGDGRLLKDEGPHVPHGEAAH